MMFKTGDTIKVAMVGAKRGDQHGLCNNDYATVRHIMRVLQESGAIQGAPKVKLDIINLDEKHGGRDFLAEDTPADQHKADIVLLCNIGHKDTPSEARDVVALYARTSMYFNGSANLDPCDRMLSKKHWDKGAWANAIERTGAAFVFCSGVDDSMPMNDITPDGYESLTYINGKQLLLPLLVNAERVKSLPLASGMHAGILSIMTQVDTDDFSPRASIV